MTKCPAKKAAVPVRVGTLASVQPGDSVTLECGRVCEVGFFLGASCFVRFSDSAPRETKSLPSSTAVVSVMPRARSISAASGPVRDPVDRGDQ